MRATVGLANPTADCGAVGGTVGLATPAAHCGLELWGLQWWSGFKIRTCKVSTTVGLLNNRHHPTTGHFLVYDNNLKVHHVVNFFCGGL